MSSNLVIRPFIGREHELSLLERLFDVVRRDGPGLVLIDGPAGIGKTALIDRFLEQVGDVRVLRVTGDDVEARMPYGVIDQLLRRAGLVDDSLTEHALSGIPVLDPVDAGVRVLHALTRVATPVVLVVDDAHWVDRQSLRAVLFALRRLVADPVMTVVATRTEGLAALPEGLRRLGQEDRGARIRLQPLSADELAGLASGLGLRNFPWWAAKRLHEHTAGNPLYARALLEESPEEVWSGPLSSLPAPRSFDAVIVTRLRQLSTPARELAEAAAVLGVRCSLDTAARVSAIRAPVEAADELLGAELILRTREGSDHCIEFTHPLVQSAIYGDLPSGRRAALHQACADQVPHRWAKLRHRAAAVTTSDAALADELDEFAGHQNARGAWAEAAEALVEASRLSATETDTQERLLNAVYSMLFHGDVAEASGYRDELERLPVSARRDCVLGFLAGLSRRPLEARRLMRSAWEQCDPNEDRELAATIARRCAMHLMHQLEGEETVRWSRRALELSGSKERSTVAAEMLPLGIGYAYAGRMDEGVAAVELAIREADGSDDRPAISLKRARGWLRCVQGDLTGAHTDFSEEAEEALRIGSLGTAAFALAQLAQVEYLLGAWDDSLRHSQRAIVITTELGHPFRDLAALAACLVSAARGDWTDLEDRRRSALPASPHTAQAVVIRGLADAHLAAAQGRPQDVLLALAPLRAITPREGVDEPGFWPWQHLYADGLIATDQLTGAEEFLAHHEELAGKRGRAAPIARLVVSRGRLLAATGEHDLADERFRRAVELLSPGPFVVDLAGVRLAWGQALRRHGHRRAAAEQLASARATYEQLGARPYLERCDSELQACGLTPGPRSEFNRGRLTPQELAVAQLVASGLSNRRAAEELVVSVGTVEFHLTHIYAKLNISSRAQLAAQWRVAAPPSDTH